MTYDEWRKEIQKVLKPGDFAEAVTQIPIHKGEIK